MDASLLSIVIPAVLGSGAVGVLVTLWAKRRVTSAEAQKLAAEADSQKASTDLSAAGFHRDSALRAQDRLDETEQRYAALHGDLLRIQRDLVEQQTEGYTLRLENDRLKGDCETLQDIIARLRSLNIKLRSRVDDSGRTERLDELQLNIDTRIERHKRHIEERGKSERRTTRGTAEDRSS